MSRSHADGALIRAQYRTVLPIGICSLPLRTRTQDAWRATVRRHQRRRRTRGGASVVEATTAHDAIVRTWVGAFEREPTPVGQDLAPRGLTPAPWTRSSAAGAVGSEVCGIPGTVTLRFRSTPRAAAGSNAAVLAGMTRSSAGRQAPTRRHHRTGPGRHPDLREARAAGS